MNHPIFTQFGPIAMWYEHTPSPANSRRSAESLPCGVRGDWRSFTAAKICKNSRLPSTWDRSTVCASGWSMDSWESAWWPWFPIIPVQDVCSGGHGVGFMRIYTQLMASWFAGKSFFEVYFWGEPIFGALGLASLPFSKSRRGSISVSGQSINLYVHMSACAIDDKQDGKFPIVL